MGKHLNMLFPIKFLVIYLSNSILLPYSHDKVQLPRLANTLRKR